MHRLKTDIAPLVVASAARAEFFFRIGMEAAGNENFTEFIELLLKFIENKHNCKTKELNTILSKMLLAQERKDWIALSDTIEHEFIDFFNKNMNIQE